MSASDQGAPSHPDARPGSAVSLWGVSKAYGREGDAVLALDDISLQVGIGEFICLVGASGCGKSTLLNLIVGLDRPSKGEIEIRSGRATLVFQETALFPWLTVKKNIEVALRLRGVPRNKRQAISVALLDLVHLGGFLDKRPHELSGGMRQRVALARALAQQAEILLMDEPFASLDAITRDLLHDELERLWQETGFTVVFVTHNVREAVRLADRVVLLSSRPGRVVAEYEVNLPRPRRIESAEVARLASVIGEGLHREVRGHNARQ